MTTYQISVLGNGIDECQTYDDLDMARYVFGHMVKNEYCYDDHKTPKRSAVRDQIRIFLDVWSTENGDLIENIATWDANYLEE